MEIDSFSFGLVIHPFSFVDVATGLDQSSLAVRHIIDPISLIECSIFPNLLPSAISLPVFPLPIVNDSIFQLCGLFPLIRKCLGEVELAQSEICVLDCLGT